MSTINRFRRPVVLYRRVFAAVLASALLAAACGGSPTAEESGGAPPGSGNAERSLEDVYGQVEGMTGEKRRQRLIELASEEDGPINIYTSINTEISQTVLDRFTEETGLEVNLYRAPNQDILRRVREEERAKIADVADVIANNDLEQSLHARDGVLAPLKTPATEGNVVVHDTWAAVDQFIYVAAWNTNNVDEPPTTWEDVFAGNSGKLAYQFGDFNWFATLVNDYYVEEQGMTEREAVDMIKEGVSQSAQVVDGHTLGANLLAAGEYAVASSVYYYRVTSLMEEGAPIAWEPAVQPLIARATGVGIHHRTQRPASALLLTEFMLTDMQRMLPEFNKTPALEGVPGGLPAKYDPIPMNLDLILDDQEKWLGLHDEVTGAIGGEVIEE